MKTNQLALSLLDRVDVLILDLETTGILEQDPETRIVQLTLMNTKGKVVFSSLINPLRKIPPVATEAHGLKDSDVAMAPTLLEVIPLVRGFLEGCTLVAYNAAFDVHLLTHRLRQLGESEKIFIKEIRCAMEMYQHWNGSRRYLPLPNLSGGRKHDAITDCLNTLLLLQKMAGVLPDQKDTLDLDF